MGHSDGDRLGTDTDGDRLGTAAHASLLSLGGPKRPANTRQDGKGGSAGAADLRQKREILY